MSRYDRVVLNPIRIIEALRKVNAALDDGAVHAAIRATQAAIGDQIVVDDALRAWEKSPEFERLVLEGVKRGGAWYHLDDLVDSFIEESEFFGPDLDATGRKTVETFLGFLNAELKRRHPNEVLLARQEVELSFLLRQAADRKALPAAPNPVALIERTRAARASLGTWLLPPVPREEFLQLVLPMLRDEHVPRLLAIVAPAGYGKTTVLAQLHDAFEARPIALIRGDEVILDDVDSAAAVDRRMSTVAGCGSLVEVATSGPLILIDTLDLLLTGAADTLIVAWMRDLIRAGARVVVTCRDFEFSKVLEPVEIRLAGVPAVVKGLPLFTPDEVRRAAVEFIRTGNPAATEETAQQFAGRVLALSADQRRIEEIVRNPLLLAMLCDLFGTEGEIPDDLTIGLLYTTYWDRKIGASRARSGANRIARAKVEMCYRIASVIFRSSVAHLQLNVSEADLDTGGAERGDALAELQSEGVLRERQGYFFFFHQTLAEFCVARWLASHTAGAERDAWLDRLNSGAAPIHWWPIVRQFVAILPSAQTVESVLSRLDLMNPFAYRAVVFGCGSRDDAAGLEMLAAAARGDEERELLLCQALLHVSFRHVSLVISIALELLRDATVRAAKSARTVLLQSMTRLAEGEQVAVISSAIEILDARMREHRLTESDHNSLTTHFLSELVRKEWPATPDFLRMLRQRYPKVQATARDRIIRLHLRWATDSELNQLLAAAIQKAAHGDMSDSAAELLERLTGPQSPWPDLLSMLHAPLKKERWKPVQARAAARLVSKHPAELARLVEDALNGPPEHTPADHVALRIVGELAGGASRIVAEFMGRSFESIAPQRAKAITYLISDICDRLSIGEATALLDWLFEGEGVVNEQLVAAASLASVMGHRLDEVLARLHALPVAEKQDVVRAMATVSTGAHASTLIEGITREVESLPPGRWRERARVAVAAKGLQVEKARFLPLLVEAAQSAIEHVALDAGIALERNASSLSADDTPSLQPLLRSRLGGVRANVMEVFRRIAEAHELPVEIARDVAHRLQAETINKHRALSVAIWGAFLRSQTKLSDDLYETHLHSVLPLLERTDLDGGVVREVLLAQFALVSLAGDERLAELMPISIDVLRRCRLEQARDGEAAFRGIIHKLDDRVPSFLDLIASEARTMSDQNQIAVCAVIGDRRGEHSLLLEWFRTEAPANVRAAVRRQMTSLR